MADYNIRNDLSSMQNDMQVGIAAHRIRGADVYEGIRDALPTTKDGKTDWRALESTHKDFAKTRATIQGIADKYIAEVRATIQDAPKDASRQLKDEIEAARTNLLATSYSYLLQLPEMIGGSNSRAEIEQALQSSDFNHSRTTSSAYTQLAASKIGANPVEFKKAYGLDTGADKIVAARQSLGAAVMENQLGDLETSVQQESWKLDHAKKMEKEAQEAEAAKRNEE